MAYSIETRLGRPEAATDGGGGEFPPCPECGWPHEGAGDDATYEVVFLDEDEGEPAFCETCGERIPEIVFDDDLPRGRLPRG